MKLSQPFHLTMEVGSFHPDSRFIISHEYCHGFKFKTSIISEFSENACNDIYRCLQSFRTVNKDIYDVTKSDIISVPLEFYKENLNKRCFNQEIMREFIVFYLNIQAFNKPLLSTIKVENELLCKLNLPEFDEGSRFSSESLSCIQWLEMKHKLRAAFNGDAEAQQHVLSFLQPSFDYAEENKPSQIFESSSNKLSTYFNKEKINGYLRINSYLDNDDSSISKYNKNYPYLLINHLYSTQINSDVKMIIVEEILSPYNSFTTITNKNILKDYPECNEYNWTQYIPNKPLLNFDVYNTKYQIFIVHTKLNQSKKIGFDIQTLESAYLKADEFLTGKVIF